MKPLFLSILLCFFATSGLFAQKENPKELALKQAYAHLDSGMVQANIPKLQKILHPKLSLGHSNGLIETKTDLIDHLQNLYLKYKAISETAGAEIHLNKKLATVRRQIKVNGELQGKAFEVKLSVLETWIWEGRRWQLFNRHALKQN